MPLTLEALGQEAANDVTADAECDVHGKLWEAGSQDLNGAVIQNGDSGVKIAELHVCSLEWSPASRKTRANVLSIPVARDFSLPDHGHAAR